MTAATLQVQSYHGVNGGPTIASAEGGIVWNRADDEATTARIPVPSNVPGTNYSNFKALRFSVTSIGTTAVSNLAVRKSGAEASGAKLFALTTAPSSYDQCTGTVAAQGNRPADSSAPLASSPDPNTPALYSVISTSAGVFDTGSYSTAGSGVFGKFLQALLGLSHLYAGGPGTAEAMPSLILHYDEG